MAEVIEIRSVDGRFRPGQSGNPAGRPKGARNKASALVEAVMEGEAEALVRKAVEVALAGNVRLLKTFVELLIARPKGRPIELEIEPGREGDPVALLEAGMRALCAGEISPAEALPIARAAECSSRMRAREKLAALRQEEAALRSKRAAMKASSRAGRPSHAPADGLYPAQSPSSRLGEGGRRHAPTRAPAPASPSLPPRRDGSRPLATGERPTAPANNLFSRAAFLASVSPLGLATGAGACIPPVSAGRAA